MKPHAGKDIHVVLDNLSTHAIPEVKVWLEKNPNVHFHFTPVGSSWLNQIETWFGIITRQSIRRGTFNSVRVLIKQIRDYITHWNTNAKPFSWTATADEILTKVRLVEANIKTCRQQLSVNTVDSRYTRGGSMSFSRRVFHMDPAPWPAPRQTRRRNGIPALAHSSPAAAGIPRASGDIGVPLACPSPRGLTGNHSP